MCSIIAGVMIAGALTQTFMDDQRIDAENEAAEIQFAEETRRANEEHMDRTNQLTQEAQLEAAELTKSRQATALSELRAQSAQTVAGAESGLSGVSHIRSFMSNEIAGSLAQGDLDLQERATEFNTQQRVRGINTAKVNRNTNAFLTRQASTRKRLGVLDAGLGIVGSGALGEINK